MSYPRPANQDIERVTVAIPRTLLDQLETACRREDRTRSGLIRRALQAYLAQGAA